MRGSLRVWGLDTPGYPIRTFLPMAVNELRGRCILNELRGRCILNQLVHQRLRSLIAEKRKLSAVEWRFDSTWTLFQKGVISI